MKSYVVKSSLFYTYFSQVVELLLIVNWDEDPAHLIYVDEKANCINLPIIEQLCNKEQLILYLFLSGCRAAPACELGRGPCSPAGEGGSGQPGPGRSCPRRS